MSNKAEHAPTPWYHNVGAGCVEAGGRMIADIGFVGVKAVANGNYICDCVNTHDTLVKQRDDLLEACEIMTALTRIKYGNLEPDVYEEILKAEAAIAQCKPKEKL